MTDQFPAPLVPPETDLRSYQFMPLDVVRLRDAGIVDTVTGEEFRAAILLWCASWHQVPAGSLPDDDRQLAKLAGYGRLLREWEAVRGGALYGFVRCSDGRLYHPVICEKALESWSRKQSFAKRGKIGAAVRHGLVIATPTENDGIAQAKPNGSQASGLAKPTESVAPTSQNLTKDRTGQDRIGQELKKEEERRGAPSPKEVETTLAEICEILGVRLQSSTKNHDWPYRITIALSDGLEAKRDLIPAAHLARARNKLSVPYVIGVARSAREQREQAPSIKPNGNGNGQQAPFEYTDDAGWRKRVQIYIAAFDEIGNGAWSRTWGGRFPGDDPRHPKEILAEFPQLEALNQKFVQA